VFSICFFSLFSGLSRERARELRKRQRAVVLPAVGRVGEKQRDSNFLQATGHRKREKRGWFSGFSARRKESCREGEKQREI
jgi:hypothetical protein